MDLVNIWRWLINTNIAEENSELSSRAEYITIPTNLDSDDKFYTNSIDVKINPIFIIICI